MRKLWIISLILIAVTFSACGNLPPDLFFVKGHSYEFFSYDSSRNASEERFHEILNDMGFEDESDYAKWVSNINEIYDNYIIEFKNDGTFAYFQLQNQNTGVITGTYIQDRYEIKCYKNKQDKEPILNFHTWNGYVGMFLHEYYDSNQCLEFLDLVLFESKQP